jgi:hypothetical protein
MSKATKKVWNPTRFEVNIGTGTYLVEPQPIERIMEFDQVANQLMESITGLSTLYTVVDVEDGSEKAGPFEEEDEARRQLTDGTEIKVSSASFSDIAQALIDAPYPALRCLIPDLKEEDVRGSSLPNLKFVLDLVIEVNGVKWFETFLKNSISPLLPEIVKIAVDAAKTAIVNSTSQSETMAINPNGGKLSISS